MEYRRNDDEADRPQRQPLSPQEQVRPDKDLAIAIPKENIAEMKDELEREHAVPPHKHHDDILNGLLTLNLDESSRHNRALAAVGVEISSRPQQVEGIRSQAPRIQFDNNQDARINPYTRNWDGRNLRVSQPGKIDNIICIHTDAKDKQVIERAVEKLKAMAQNLGIQIETWNIEPKAYYTREELSDLMENLEIQQKATKKRYLLLHFDHKGSKSHGLLKLLERRYSTVTQQITTKTAGELIRKPQIVQNILLKLNCKIGGLNYQVISESYSQNRWTNSKRVMFVGYNVANPIFQSRDEVTRKIPPSSPSIVGFSFNGAPNPEAFIGDFHYQAPKQERVHEILYQRMKWMLKLFEKNRGDLPEVIFIIRNDNSENQYEMAMITELAVLRKACTEFGEENNRPGYSLKFVLIAATKKQDELTHYEALNNDLNLSTDEIQATMAALCLTHQISNSPISIPEPVYQADEWAKRGNQVWQAYEENYTVPRKKKKGDYSDFPIDFDVMTERLSYWNSPLQMYRINA